MIMLADLTSLSVTDLSSTVILQLAVFNFLLPVAMVSIVGGGLGAVKGILSLLIGIGITTTIPQYLTARLLGPQLVAFAGSLTSLVYLLLWLRIFEHKTPGEHRRFGKEKEATHELGFLRAGSIYLVMFVLILAANPLFPKISGELAAVATPLSFTLDDGRVLTAKIDWIATPGVLILISTILGGLIQGAGPRIMGEAFARTAKQLAPAGVAICGIVAMATVMDVSGLIEKTAEPLIINICTK
ncbi:L-lactate permease [Sutterella seckii]|uniref:L-lactate permease n=1 Tax=Sutterella seckii TaxID=1944635 RepID=A0A6I1EHU6_9BURK|nr:L-lactate permease [Sutterella seckii]KAB7650562.1 L-lactate permease [Sutterella seckii]